jgi:hypothetical protein
MMVLLALAVELRPRSMIDHPFARHDIAAGVEIGERDVEWRPVPAGFLPPIRPEGMATVAIPKGAPLVPGLLAATPVVPAGWWALEVAIPEGAVPGAPLRLAIASDTGVELVPGLLISEGSDGAFGDVAGLVAVPEEQAARAAAAAATGRITVLVGR